MQYLTNSDLPWDFSLAAPVTQTGILMKCINHLDNCYYSEFISTGPLHKSTSVSARPEQCLFALHKVVLDLVRMGKVLSAWRLWIPQLVLPVERSMAQSSNHLTSLLNSTWPVSHAAVFSFLVVSWLL